MIRAKVKLSTVAHRGYVTFFWLIHAESDEWGTVVKQMLTEVVDRGRKLYSVNGSCIVDRERKLSRMLPLLTPVPIPPSSHTTFFPISIMTNAQVFLSHNCPKMKENLFQKSLKFT